MFDVGRCSCYHEVILPRSPATKQTPPIAGGSYVSGSSVICSSGMNSGSRLWDTHMQAVHPHRPAVPLLLSAVPFSPPAVPHSLPTMLPPPLTIHLLEREERSSVLTVVIVVAAGASFTLHRGNFGTFGTTCSVHRA